MSGYRIGKQTHIWSFIALLILSGLLAFFVCDSASATTPAISTAAAELSALQELVDELNAELEKVAEEYNYVNQQCEDTQAAADEATANLEEAEADLAAARERLCERLVSIYKNGDIGTIQALLTADSISDALSLMDGFRSLAQEDSRLVDEVHKYKDEQAQLQAQLDEQLKQLTEYQEQVATAKAKVEAQLAKKQQALKGKEAELAALKKAEAERQARLAEQARQYQIWLASRPGQVVSLAKSFLGVPYVWGGYSPSGFDCSGLVKYVYAKVGIYLPHSSAMMYSYGTPVSKSNLRAGDIVFFYSPIHHVGIYIGNGKMVDATGNQVQISNVFKSSYTGARRLL